MTTPTISHALVLPDRDFMDWLRATNAYTSAFERVSIVRSPAGNDLSRYRDVSAVQTAGVWFDNNPITHIRRAYPAVVRIDVIKADTPTALAAALAERVARRDRFGAWLNDGHLVERFVIGWASDTRPARILARFNLDIGGRKNEGIEIAAGTDAILRAPVSGRVTGAAFPFALGYGDTVQIQAALGGKTYLVTVTRLRQVEVRAGQTVSAGDRIGLAAGSTSKIVVQEQNGGQAGFALPNVLDPSPLIYWDGLRIRPTADGVRVREKPGTQFAVKGQLTTADYAETLEMHGRTLEKVGVQDAWLKLRTPTGVEGFSAAWLLSATTREALTDLPGVNLDPQHPLGKPMAARIDPLGWVRLPYRAVASQGFGSPDAAHAFYEPLLDSYLKVGTKIVLVLTHQTFGEGGGFDWSRMYKDERGTWDLFIPRFVEVVRSIARRYTGRGIVYQVWNEQDTAPANAAAAVPMQPADYAKLLAATVRAIRVIDPGAKVITGGHVTGPGSGKAYCQATFAAIPADARPDGIAVHPYGRGAPGANPRYAPFGRLDDEINAYAPLLPGAPIYFTEWGVLDKPTDPTAAVATYASGFLNHIRQNYRRRVAAAIWYAWADTMHNGYGLVDRSDQPKQPLYDVFLDN